MKLRLVFLGVLIMLLAACNNDTSDESIDTAEAQESEEGVKAEEREEIENTEQVAESTEVEVQAEQQQNELSTDVRLSGEVELTEEGITVDLDSNLPEGVELEIRAESSPFGGAMASLNVAFERLPVDEQGNVNGMVPYKQEDVIERYLNDPIGVEIRFNPSNISRLKDNADELRAFYGEDGENLEGPFVEEFWRYTHEEHPFYYISASDVVFAEVGAGFAIEEPIAGEPPEDYGDTNVWMEAEIVDIDHRYVHVEGRSNLLYGTILMGNIKSDEEKFLPQNWYNHRTFIKKDGTFTMPIAYKSITDEGFVVIYSEAKLGHNRAQILHETYGEEFELLEGDIVKPRFEGKTEQKIELTIPFNPGYEDAPDEIDVTLDGDEMKLILSDEILFEFGESDITQEGDQVIQEVAAWLEDREYSGLIKVHGHTDNISGDDINQPLSEDRAANVHETLQTYLENLTDYEFEVKGFGKYEPIATNDTEEGRERNRRVEILLEVEAAE